MTTLTVSTLKLNALFSAIDITRPTGMSIDTLGLFISIDNPVMRQPAAESLEIKTLNVYGYLQNIVLSVDGTHSDALTIDALELECDIDTVTLKNSGDRLRIIQPLNLLLTLPYDSITFEISEPNTLSLRPLGKSDINAKINSVLLIVDAEKKRIADEIAKRIAAILEDTDDDIDVESPDDPNFDPFQVKLNGSDLLTLTEGDDLPLNPSVDEIGEIAKRKYNQNLSLVSRILGNKVVWVDYDPSKRQLQFEFKPGDVPTNTLKIDYGRSKNKKQLPLETIQEGDDGHIIQTDFNAVTEANKNALKKRAELDAIDRKINQIKLYKEALTKEIAMLDAYCPSSISARAWCVAYNEDLTGETKTIEVDYVIERDPLTNQIRNDTGFWIPATQEQSTPTAPDSILQHTMATSEHATWFNLAMLPAAQRDHGRYRVATLTSVDKNDDTCNITLDGIFTASLTKSKLTDSLPILPASQTNNYSNVAITYPPCNAQVFETGDRVIFDVTAQAVIGFYSNPKKCTDDPGGGGGGESWMIDIFNYNVGTINSATIASVSGTPLQYTVNSSAIEANWNSSGTTTVIKKSYYNNVRYPTTPIEFEWSTVYSLTVGPKTFIGDIQNKTATDQTATTETTTTTLKLDALLKQVMGLDSYVVYEISHTATASATDTIILDPEYSESRSYTINNNYTQKTRSLRLFLFSTFSDSYVLEEEQIRVYQCVGEGSYGVNPNVDTGGVVPEITTTMTFRTWKQNAVISESSSTTTTFGDPQSLFTWINASSDPDNGVPTNPALTQSTATYSKAVNVTYS
jgi:hypothetical protein